ncbi:hypothetical protein ACFFQF_18225 [Haladaptatus pallidirubidus]|nr:hypothetical protein [Haladaptatus pallidirubidus]
MSTPVPQNEVIHSHIVQPGLRRFSTIQNPIDNFVNAWDTLIVLRFM